MKTKKLTKNGKVDSFDPQVFLDTAGVARKVAEFRRGESIYSQGEAAESVMYVQKGGVKFSVVKASGREAVVATFGPSDFFGEGWMAGQTVRMGTAGHYSNHTSGDGEKGFRHSASNPHGQRRFLYF